QPVAVVAAVAPEPIPAAPPAIKIEPIEPPSFKLMEDDPSMGQRHYHRHEVEMEPEEPPLSILDPTPRPEPPDFTKQIVLTVIVVLTGMLAAYVFHSSSAPGVQLQ